jgi:membrane-bound lytic murein transglycosylase A
MGNIYPRKNWLYLMMKKKYVIILTSIVIIGIVLGYRLFKPHQVKITLKSVTFADLPGWGSEDIHNSLIAFQASCRTFLRHSPSKSVGSESVNLIAKDWHAVCIKALAFKNNVGNEDIRHFFEMSFTPMKYVDKNTLRGLFTGYYMPLLRGSLHKTNEFQVPIYGVPSNLITIDLSLFDSKLKNRRIFGRLKGRYLIPFYTREEINNGVIKEDAPVIAWINDWVDRSFLEIQGSGVIELDNHQQLVINYAAENGAPYTSIAKVLIDLGLMSKDNASMQRIRKYLIAHFEDLHYILNKNKSFVFFEVVAQNQALGSQGVPLTPGYSLAVDKKWVPLGAPIWLSTQQPQYHSKIQVKLERLMIAQDTGGAIKGPVRGDVYWGTGEKATSIAGRMKSPGYYWLLLPKNIALTIEKNTDRH